MSKVIGIKSHPKYKDAAALRVWLNEGGQDNFGTQVDMTRFIDSDNPDVQAMLSDLNSWCESLKELPSGQLPPTPSLVDMSKLAKIVDKHMPTGMDIGQFDGGLKKGDFYNFGAIESPLLEAFPIRTLPGRGGMFENRIYLNTEFVKKESTDANPST
jgi:hypothetical protein